MKKIYLFLAAMTATVCSLQAVDTNDYLYFVGLNGNDTVKLDTWGTPDAVQLEYSTNRANWSNYTIGSQIALQNEGDTVFFRAGQNGVGGVNATFSKNVANHYHFHFGADDKIAAGGNIMSLYDASCQQDTMTKDGFVCMFQLDSQLVSAPKMPATQLAEECYYNMYEKCRLVESPELPATKMVKLCYAYMFASNPTLVRAHDLNPENLADLCFAMMYYKCAALSIDTCAGECSGAELVVPEVEYAPSQWNLQMFKGCKGDDRFTGNASIKTGARYCMGAVPTGVETINDNRKDNDNKFFENGQLYIRHDNIIYDAKGQVVK